MQHPPTIGGPLLRRGKEGRNTSVIVKKIKEEFLFQ